MAYRKIKIDFAEYRAQKHTIPDNLLNLKAELYWIANPDCPEDINNGYIGVTNIGFRQRFLGHKKYPSTKMKEVFQKYENSRLYPQLICSGHYINLLKLERYFRPKLNIGWNRHTGGHLTPYNAHKSVKTRKLNDIIRIDNNELTSTQKSQESRLHNDKIKRANGKATSGQNAASSRLNNDTIRKALGQLTTAEKSAISRLNNDIIRQSRGELTNGEKISKSKRENDKIRKLNNAISAYQKSANARLANDAIRSRTGELTSSQKTAKTRTHNKLEKLHFEKPHVFYEIIVMSPNGEKIQTTIFDFSNNVVTKADRLYSNIITHNNQYQIINGKYAKHHVSLLQI